MKFIKQIFSAEDLSSIEPQGIIMNGSDTVIKLGGGVSIVTKFTGEKTFASKDALSELNNWAVIGALLFASDTDYVVQAGTWDPKSTKVTTPTKDGYTLIGVCVGKGLWAYVSWTGLTSAYKWAASNTDDLYKWHPSMVHGHGYENTEHVLNNHADVLTGTIWEQIKSVRDAGIPVFLPSKYELLEAQENICDDEHQTEVAPEGGTAKQACTYKKNLGMLLSGSACSYWSSSQTAGSACYAIIVDFTYSLAYYTTKTSAYRSLVFLHF